MRLLIRRFYQHCIVNKQVKFNEESALYYKHNLLQ